MNARPKRRWYQFSLRMLLAALTIACVGFGWLGMKVRAKQRERAAAKAISELGGHVMYDYQWDSIRKRPTPIGPEWLRKWLGNDFFADVKSVNLNMAKPTDADLRRLREFPGLESLSLMSLFGSPVTDA